LRLSVGAGLLVLGVVGLFLPVLQGWLFILAGLSVMAPESPAAHRAMEWVKARLPHRKSTAPYDRGAHPSSERKHESGKG
jgi:uncharacterized membrane protein YbaN (DUF454 family)